MRCEAHACQEPAFDMVVVPIGRASVGTIWVCQAHHEELREV